MRILAIDPGTTHSAAVGLDCKTQEILYPRIKENECLAIMLSQLSGFYDRLALEMVASYGMPVGRDVFETCVWIGRFMQAWRNGVERVYRKDVKLHLCRSARAKDCNIRQALIDRFGKPGTKKHPGPTFGLKGDMWAALAVAVTWADKQEEKTA